MADLDLFLFEITLQKLLNYVNCSLYEIKCDFPQMFSITLCDPDQPPFQPHPAEDDTDETKNKKRKKKRKPPGPFSQLVEPIEESVFLKTTTHLLEGAMKRSPMEVSVYTMEGKLGSLLVPWSQDYYLYLERVKQSTNPLPIEVLEKCDIVQEDPFGNMVTLELCVRLSNFKDKTTNAQLASVFPELNSAFFNSDHYSDNESKTEHGKIVVHTKVETKKSRKTKKKKAQVQAKREIAQCSPSETKVETDDLKNDAENNETKNSETGRRMDITDLERFIDTMVKDELSAALETEINNYAKASKSLPSLSKSDFAKTSTRGSEEKRISFANQVYCVGYCTCERATGANDNNYPPQSNSASERESYRSQRRHKYTIYTSEIQCKMPECSHSTCSMGLPIEIAPYVDLVSCENVTCEVKEIEEKLKKEEIISPVCGDTEENKLRDSCYCTCECVINFVRTTTYCKLCGGYEEMGEDLFGVPNHELPTPCPLYHDMMDVAKPAKAEKKKRLRPPSPDDDDRKDKVECWFDYAAPKKWHDKCGLGCCPFIRSSVPRNMGWLWSSENVPGMKFRPFWRPGACSKNVIALLKAARNPGEVKVKKKRRKEPAKKLDKRPLLVVHKKDGEYNVTMETMKIYPKPRTFNQQPYENKPPLTYTIGRTEEENMERLRKKQRMQRRLERDQRKFIESAFTNICEEVCLKTYQQAIQILPDAEGPGCSCFIPPQGENVQIDHSCSCSEDKDSPGSETDDDEWFVEFTAPIAKYDPTFKPLKITKAEASSQYSYLDYRVKLRDRFGNEVPRFFIGPDGRKKCSDLGGFWDPCKNWLKINKDGFIGADNRWAPISFTGPCGEIVEIDLDECKFQDASGNWLTVGVDGYVDSKNKWRYYPVTRERLAERRKAKEKNKQKAKPAPPKEDFLVKEIEKPHWHCFGDGITTETLAQMGVTGHGKDKQLLLKQINEMVARGQKVIIREPQGVPRSWLTPEERNRIKEEQDALYQEYKCKHPKPSKRGIASVDRQGNKTLFKITDYTNKRPTARIQGLKKRGIPVSPYHVPCFDSFINAGEMKKQLRARLMALAKNVIETK